MYSTLLLALLFGCVVYASATSLHLKYPVRDVQPLYTYMYSNMKIKNVSPLFCAPAFLGAVMCVHKFITLEKYDKKTSSLVHTILMYCIFIFLLCITVYLRKVRNVTQKGTKSRKL